MGYDINFFRNDINGQVAGYETPYSISKSVRLVCAVPMIPDRSMRAHDHHAVDKRDPQKSEIKIAKEKDKKTGHQQQRFRPPEKGKPVLFSFENVHSGKELADHLPRAGDDQAPFGI